MKIRNLLGICTGSVLLALNLCAQPADSLKSLPKVLRADSKHSLKQKNPFSAKSLSVPVLMIAYGFGGMELQVLEDVNIEVNEEMREHNTSFRNRTDDYLQFAPAASAFMLEGIGVKGKHNLKDKAIIYGTGLAIMTVLVHSLKKVTHELRPDGSKFNSFPSGHTANAFMGAAFLQKEYGFRSPWYGYAGYLMASGTGIMRMYNNKHWLADVLAGVGIGILSTRISYWLFEKIERRRLNKTVTASRMAF